MFPLFLFLPSFYKGRGFVIQIWSNESPPVKIKQMDIISLKGKNYPPRIYIARKIKREKERESMYKNHGTMTTNKQKQKKKR